jgi:hypothetical protein
MKKKSKHSPTKHGSPKISRLKKPYTSPDGHTVMLTDKQHKFAENALNVVDSETLIRRTMELYNTEYGVARVIARENFQKPNLQLYLGDRGYKALDTIHEIASDTEVDKAVRLNAAKDLADRQFGKATQRTEVKQQTVSVNLTFANALPDNE